MKCHSKNCKNEIKHIIYGNYCEDCRVNKLPDFRRFQSIDTSNNYKLIKQFKERIIRKTIID